MNIEPNHMVNGLLSQSRSTLRGAGTAAPAGRPRVLLVEDQPDLAWTYRGFLAKAAIDLDHVATAGAALSRLDQGPPAVMLLDLRLPDMDGLDVLRHTVARGLPTAVIVITAYGDVEVAVEAMRRGAWDFLAKPFTASRLRASLGTVLERQRRSGLLAPPRRDTYHGFVGSSLPMQTLYRTIENVAPSRAPVFITGESGVGKELCAQAIHAAGPRRDRPIVALNCAAIPRDLMESEVFGHARGAFTGAAGARGGAARRADGGTLFLDEICEMDPALQGKLLRFAQTGTFQPVGSDAVEGVDVRLICATNKDPWAEVEAGRFRADLYYRLHVIPVQVPALRERKDDVLLLARKFLLRAAREEGKAFRGFDPAVEAALAGRAWPGNVRELQNAIRRIVVLHEGRIVRPEMLPSPLRPGAPAPVPRAAVRPLRQMERELIESAIAEAGGSVSRAAQRLGVNPSTIYRKREAWRRGEPD